MIEPLIVLGPPGTGKTTCLLEMIEQDLAQGISPDRIGFMTFTRRGVEEGIRRASQKFNVSRSNFRYFNTLHSCAFRYLALENAQVFTGDRIREFVEAYPEHNIQLSGYFSSEDGTYSSFSGDNLILFLDNYARTIGHPIEQVLRNASTSFVDPDRAITISIALRAFKNEMGLFDFTDMLEEFIRMDDPPRLDVLYIDEAQDLSDLQWRMVEILSRHVKKLVVAGDDDQSIFTWGGASERFITLPGKVHLLKQSWRVPRAVHGLANAMIKQVVNRREKEWNPRDEEGASRAVVGLFDVNPTALAKQGSAMLLARTAKMVQQFLIPYCRSNGLLYQAYENSSIRPTHAAAITAWDALHQGQDVDIEAVGKIYDLLPSESHGFTKGIARGYKVQIARLAKSDQPIQMSLAELRKDYGLQAEGPWDKVFTSISEGDIKYIKAVLANGFNVTEKPRIQISTIHRVKGGQADTVILMSDQAKATERVSIDNPDEEVRVFYTAVTRTYKNLVVVQPARSRYFAGLFS